MKIKLDNAFDTHWLYVNRFQGTSFNLIPRVRLSKRLKEKDCQRAIAALIKKHPHICSNIQEEQTDENESAFYFVTDDSNQLSTSYDNATTSQLDDVLSNFSSKIRYQLNVEQNQLLHVQFWVSEDETVIELICAHLLGDAISDVRLLRDLITFIDQACEGDIAEEALQERLEFDELRYGWVTEPPQIQAIPIPDPLPENTDWPTPEMVYARYDFPLERYFEINQLLKEKGISGTTTDLFYYVEVYIYQELLKEKYELSTVLSYRHLLPTEADKINLDTSVVFSPTAMEESLIHQPREWIGELKKQRTESITPAGVMNLMNFLRCLNKSMYRCSHEEGKALLAQLMPLNTFSFNNYGNMDKELPQPKNFKITDLDIHSNSPGQRVRLRGYNDMIKMSTELYQAGSVTCDEFWALFNQELDRVLQEL